MWEYGFSRPAFEMHVENPARLQYKACATFELCSGSRGLMQFARCVIQPLHRHGRPARFEEQRVIIEWCAVDDVFEVEPGDSGNEQTAVGCGMLQAPDSIVTWSLCGCT